MGFLLLNAEWDQCFIFCSKSQEEENIECGSLPLREASLWCWAVSFLFIPLSQKWFTLLLMRDSQSPKHLESICCMKCILSLVKRINAKQILSPKLTATPSSPCQWILASLLHPQSYFYILSEHVPCLLRCKDRERFSQLQIIPPIERALLQYRPVSLAIWKYHISPTTKIKNSDRKLFSSKMDFFHIRRRRKKKKKVVL